MNYHVEIGSFFLSLLFSPLVLRAAAVQEAPVHRAQHRSPLVLRVSDLGKDCWKNWVWNRRLKFQLGCWELAGCMGSFSLSDFSIRDHLISSGYLASSDVFRKSCGYLSMCMRQVSLRLSKAQSSLGWKEPLEVFSPGFHISTNGDFTDPLGHKFQCSPTFVNNFSDVQFFCCNLRPLLLALSLCTREKPVSISAITSL